MIIAYRKIVHGYSGKPDLAKSVNVFYLQLMSLRASVFFEYVPSEANIADLSSRLLFSDLLEALSGLEVPQRSYHPMVVPDVRCYITGLDRLMRPIGIFPSKNVLRFVYFRINTQNCLSLAIGIWAVVRGSSIPDSIS